MLCWATWESASSTSPSECDGLTCVGRTNSSGFLLLWPNENGVLWIAFSGCLIHRTVVARVTSIERGPRNGHVNVDQARMKIWVPHTMYKQSRIWIAHWSFDCMASYTTYEISRICLGLGFTIYVNFSCDREKRRWRDFVRFLNSTWRNHTELLTSI